MRAYIIMVAAAAVLSAFCDILMPGGWQKYIGILTGAILLTALVSPIVTLRGGNLPKLVLPEQDYIEYDINAAVQEELAARVEQDIKERMLREFATECSVSVKISIKDEQISGVEQIRLGCAENLRAAERLREIYGCEKVVFG